MGQNGLDDVVIAEKDNQQGHAIVEEENAGDVSYSLKIKVENNSFFF